MTMAADHSIRWEQKFNGERTLYINGGQAMQAWERELMEFSADLLGSYGNTFAEAGLGFGLSALRMSTNLQVTSHTVVELHDDVIQMFRTRCPNPPRALRIVLGDFFDWIRAVEPESLDGIFFDPALPRSRWDDAKFWDERVPWMRRAIRRGGALVPFFSTRPVLRKQFLRHFEEVRCFPRPFTAYRNTVYTYTRQGTAIVQCFVKA
jgi:spermidine synthase